MLLSESSHLPKRLSKAAAKKAAKKDKDRQAKKEKRAAQLASLIPNGHEKPLETLREDHNPPIGPGARFRRRQKSH